MTVETALRAVGLLLGVHTVLTSLEYLAVLKEFNVGGILSWKVYRLNFSARMVNGPLRDLFDAIYGAGGMAVVLLVRLAAGGALILSPIPSVLAFVSVGAIGVSGLIISSRTRYGMNGADQMAQLIALTLFLGLAVGTQRALEVAAAFVACQAALCYAAAGIAKLVSRLWRSGEAVALILSSGAYGIEPLSRLLFRSVPLAKGANWSVVAFELAFPLSLVGIRSVTIALVAAGVLFHFANAAVMGLNDFFWAFTAPYPAVLFFSAKFGVL